MVAGWDREKRTCARNPKSQERKTNHPRHFSLTGLFRHLEIRSLQKNALGATMHGTRRRVGFGDSAPKRIKRERGLKA